MSSLQNRINALHSSAVSANSAEAWRALAEELLRTKTPKPRKSRSKLADKAVPVTIRFADGEVIRLSTYARDKMGNADVEAVKRAAIAIRSGELALCWTWQRKANGQWGKLPIASVPDVIEAVAS